MGLQQNLRQETVDKLTLRKAVTVGSSSSVRDAILAMRKGRLGCAIVVDANQRPVGLFTEAMLRHLVCQAPRQIDDPVTKHAATTFPWVARSDAIETVLEALETKNHRFVVVVDASGKVAGLAGQKGLMEYVAEHFPREVMVQRLGTREFPRKREGA